VENAIWHGLLHKVDGKGQLTIRLTLAPPAMLMVIIEDNGVGRQKAKEMKSKEAVKSKSCGMQISHDRLELLNRELPPVVIEDILDKDGIALGTRVILYIPIQYNSL